MSLEERLKDLGEIIRQDATKKERERVLDLVKSFWCGEPGCDKHYTNWPQLIELIKGDK